MTDTQARHPRGIGFIIGNEGCERFSFYGMRAILTEHLITLYAQTMHLSAADAKNAATADYHLFTAAAYALPMMGAILADRLLGKYRTIFWLSLLYCVGHAVLAVGEESLGGMHLGLALIAVGSGGIKPCVSAFVGDQYRAGQEKLVEKIFQAFYFIINFGSFFATLLVPWLKVRFGASVAFGIPGILMGLATLILWLGRNRYQHVAPQPGGRLGRYDAVSSMLLFLSLGSLWFTGALPWWGRLLVSVTCVAAGLAVFAARARIQPDRGVLSVLWQGVRHRQPGETLWGAAERRLDGAAVDGTRAVLRLLSVFALVSVFWALFDQRGSSWVVQAKEMLRTFDTPWGPMTVEASQINALNPALVMVLIPLMAGVLLPAWQKLGLRVTPLGKMTAGMAISALSFVAVALIQRQVDASAPQTVSVLWQVVPFVLITLGEVLVSVTGLEFAYTQAPRSMKSTVVGLWSLSVSVGNLLVALLAGLKSLPPERFFWTFAGLMALSAVMFAWRARSFRGQVVLQG
jgi:POT family proton-dependent oligopeptide transporter